MREPGNPDGSRSSDALAGRLRAILLLAGIVGAAGVGGASEVRVGWSELRVTITSAQDTLISLPDVILVRDSVHVWVDSLLLTPGYDFTVDYPARQIRLARPWPTGVTVLVRYRALPVEWPIRQAWMVPSSAEEETSGVSAPPVLVGSRRLAGTQPTGDLRIGGSKTFAIQVGTNRDLSLEQSLRVSINGSVGEDVQVTAELSDQNLPIQPEGTTEDIRELDKVLVEISSPHYRTVLGSYDVAYQRGEFGRYARHLDGAQAESRYDRWGLMGGIASARGRFRSYLLPVIDGNQGPYRLTDDAGNVGIVVIAGTERVWLDGQLLRRGENNDYTMDYSAGEITFTRRRLIAQEMRIVVDYEFASEQFARTSVLASGYLGNRAMALSLREGWQMAVFFAQEGDNADEPLAITLDDSAKATLASAGDDPARASRPGWVRQVGGAYRAVDLAAEHFERADPDSGEYDVTFTRVGPGKGSYVRGEDYFSQEFRYVGPGRGDWIPRIVYPLPERQRLLAVWTGFEPARRLRVEGEAALSDLDHNTLSPLDDRDNRKFAGRLSLALAETPLGGVNHDLGLISFSAVGRGVQSGFVPMSRTTEAEDNRRWGLELSTARSQERTAELSTTYQPRPGHRLDADVGWFDRDTTADAPAYRAWRSGASWRTSAPGWPAMKLFLEQIRSRTRQEDTDARYGTIWRGDAEARYPVWYLSPRARLQGESNEGKQTGKLVQGARYGLWSAGLATAGIESFAASGNVEQRVDDRYDSLRTQWEEQQRALTQVWRAAVRQWKGLSATAEYTWRRREGPSVGAATISDVADVDARHDAWDGLMRHAVRYRVAATRTARRERLYVYVGAGRGDFAPVVPGDRRAILSETEVMEVSPGDPRASYILRYRDTGEFQPTVDLSASWQMNLDFTRAWRIAPDPRSNLRRPLWQRALRVISTETSVQVSETDSTRNRDLYLVKFWTFRQQGRSPTVRGTWQLRQDLTLWPNARRGDLRFRVSDSEDYDASLFQGRTAPAITRQREYALRGRLRFARISTDWMGELAHQSDIRSGSQFDYRAKRVLFDQTWAYHPTLQTEWALRNEDGAGSDPTPDADIARDPAKALRAYLVALEPSYRQAWGNRGMVRLSAQWSGVFGENLKAGKVLPIRLLNGRNTGHNFRWTALVNYRLSSLVTASFTYTGWKTPGSAVVHTGRAEVRATF